ncbi:hypothetical protein C8E03_102342 [Lachnotalea glycerini]|jgi:hypothetical protein|uniref:Uncharacterized protein n=1 Tax=Lachnotalea glycerini TaxID=1763509 RepID=A0A318EUZ8_9FIRM|nr:hypothetical protein C8E03_102342 [Lachnotalea glycerini]
MDYIDINGKPFNIKKKVNQHINKLKNSSQDISPNFKKLNSSTKPIK